MKFSDMMGKGDPSTTEEVDPDATAIPAPPPPTPAAAAPVQFGERGPVGAEAVLPPPPTPSGPNRSSALMFDVVNELKPGSDTPAASTQQLDASAWLDGLGGIDDDLLPS